MDSTSPLVSIALCIYNGAAYLPAQLDTLVAQTYQNIEIIAVDDCSTDDSVKILSQYAVKYPFIKIFRNEQNLGFIKNYQKAILLTSGELIAPADQDDIWNLNKIELMVNAIGNNIMLYHDSAFINNNGYAFNKKMSDVRNFYKGNDPRVFLFENCISGHSMIFKRELLRYFKGFNETIIHDWWLVYIALNNGTINYLPQVLVQYRQHDNASTNILRQFRGQVKPKKNGSLQKVEHQLAVTMAFADYPFNKDQAFNNRLLLLMQKRMNSYFSFQLAAFVYKHRKVLLYIQKKSATSKLNFIIKMFWGYKLKRIFN